MANAQHVAKLRQGVQAWNAWRAENPGTAPDLSDLNPPADARQCGPAQGEPIDLRGVNLSRAVLTGANLAHARLQNADLGGADLEGANLAEADLAGARLVGANLCDARLGGVRNLTQAALNRTKGSRATELPDGLAQPPAWLGGEEPAPPATAADTAEHRPPLERGDPYSVLGVGPKATAREIRSAYLRLVKQLHPDGRTSGAVSDDAGERLKLINDAYRELKTFDRQAAARKAERRRRARRVSAMFVAGMMTAAAPAIVAAVGLYYMGWFETPEPRLVSAVAPAPTGDLPRPQVVITPERDNGPAEAWREAERLGTREVWERFIGAHPDGEFAVEARAAIAAIERAETRRRAEAAAWTLADGSGDRSALERFLAGYPESEHAPQARERIAAMARAEALGREEAAAWAVAERSGERAQIERFISAYPDGVHAARARQVMAEVERAEAARRTELATWAQAERTGGKTALHQYLNDFPNGNFAAEARERVAMIEAEENDKDDTAWLKARQTNNKASYAEYLATYPDGRRAADA
ncbi:MAG: pentapeptide repeat-containing protein, partial [Hyphomicrobiaceae bacterium]|nr:pentapeptide repeat-containing protein [Hyphomicrobiaceae bacterium]